MNKEIYVQCNQESTEVAILEDKKLVEIHHDKNVDELQEGDVYLGSVSKFLPGINSAFVDIGQKKQGFLHYSDLGEHVKSLLHFANDQCKSQPTYNSKLTGVSKLPSIVKEGKIVDVLKTKMLIPVQISKEPIASKGARLTTDISIAGRYVVLVPFSSRGVSISKKIYDAKERKRLQRIVSPQCPDSFSIIVRTAAVGIAPRAIHGDIKDIINKWSMMCGAMKGKQKPEKIHAENQRIFNFLRDSFSNDFQSIVVNKKDLYLSIKDYVNEILPGKKNIVELTETPLLFDQFSITKQIKLAFSDKVPLESGGHLVIQQTEAMHVIDVNSGFKVFAKDQETNAFENNTIAAKEVVRQIRLRDLGGIIVIDFIDMRSAENRKAIFEQVKNAFKTDKARNTTLPLSKFGLLQITRQRVRPEIKINTSETCPSCKGTGKINSHSLIIDEEIEKTLDYLFTMGHKKISIALHPIVYAYLKKGFFFSTINRWRWKYKTWIGLKSSPFLHLIHYKVYGAEGKEIKLNRDTKD